MKHIQSVSLLLEPLRSVGSDRNVDLVLELIDGGDLLDFIVNHEDSHLRE